MSERRAERRWQQYWPCRRELGDPKIKEHRGRIVKTTGDGLLVEFSSAVEPVRGAVAWRHLTEAML